MSDVKKQFTYQLNLELNKQSLKDIQADLDKLQAEATSKLSQLNGKDNLTKQTKKELLSTLSSINEVKLALKNAAQAKRNFDTGISLAASDAMNKAYNEFGNDPQKLNETLDEISSGFAEGITDPQENKNHMIKNNLNC